MSFYNFFRDIFGFGGRHQPPNQGFEDQWQHGNEFRNPIWQTDEDDDEDNDDFRQPGRGNFGAGHFNVYSDPFEITRYFESQMENMMKNFFEFGNDGVGFPFGDGMKDHFNRTLPIEPPEQGNLRDQVLKPGYERPDLNNHSDQEKLDVDLDGKISSDDLSRVWKDPSSLQSVEPYNPPQRSPFFFQSFGQSISTKIIRKPDGSVEQHRTVRDSEGNEETTITQQFGDNTRTVVIKKDKNGGKSETEIVNSGPAIEPNLERPILSRDERRDLGNPLNDFPWHKFFGPNPKL